RPGKDGGQLRRDDDVAAVLYLLGGRRLVGLGDWDQDAAGHKISPWKGDTADGLAGQRRPEVVAGSLTKSTLRTLTIRSTTYTPPIVRPSPIALCERPTHSGMWVNQ